MIDSAVLDTILGLVFLFYALALVCSGLVEMIANWVKKRAKYLLRGIRDLLDDVAPQQAVPESTGWDRTRDIAETVRRNSRAESQRYNTMMQAEAPAVAEPAKAAVSGAGTPLPTEPPSHRDKISLGDVMGHPLVQPFRHATSLGKPTRNPSYLPSTVFSRTLVDLLTSGSSMEPTLADIEAGVAALDNSPKLKQSLASILKSADGEVDSFLSALETWFDRQMDRVTGSYKRWAKRWVIAIAVVVVCAGNIDSIAIARALYASDAVQAIVVQQAGDQSFCSTPGDELTCAAEATNLLEMVGIPLGWSAPDPQGGVWRWPLKLLGMLISVGAATLGAPFWYRVLDQIGSLRNTGRPPPPRS